MLFKNSIFRGRILLDAISLSAGFMHGSIL